MNGMYVRGLCHAIEAQLQPYEQALAALEVRLMDDGHRLMVSDVRNQVNEFADVFKSISKLVDRASTVICHTFICHCCFITLFFPSFFSMGRCTCFRPTACRSWTLSKRTRSAPAAKSMRHCGRKYFDTDTTQP